MIKEQRQRRPWAYWLLWIALVAAYIAVPVTHLSDYAWSYDEGAHIQAAALANAGYPLYSEVVLNKPPLLNWLLQLAFHLGGTTLSTARLAVLGMTTVGFVMLGLLAEQWWGRWAGPASMAIFLALPEAPTRAAVLMNDLPAISAALVALNAVTLFRRTMRWPWLTVSAVAYAAVLGLNSLLSLLLVPIALILLTRRLRGAHLCKRIRWCDLAHFGTLVAGLIFLGMCVVDRRGLIHWVLEFNTAPVIYETLDPDRPVWELVTRYLSCYWALVGLAIVSGTALARAPRRRFWVGVTSVWFAIILATLILWQVPRRHYLLFLLYPLVVMAGGGVAVAARWIGRRQVSVPHGGWRQTGLVVLILIGTLIFATKRITTPLEWHRWTTDQRAAQAFLKQESMPGEFIIGDDLLLVFDAGYLVPPSLADTSYRQIKTGFLRVEDVIGEVLRRQVRFVLFGTGRFAVMPSLEQWVEMVSPRHYDFGSTRIYRVEIAQPSHLLESSLGESIHLRGYSLSESALLQAGDTLKVTLYWESTATPPEDYKVFVHLLDSDGNLVAQHDSPPVLGWYPTQAWLPGVTVPDPHPIVLSQDLSPEPYYLSVGMYCQPSLERLPALVPDGSRWPDDCITLTELRITAPSMEGP